MPRSLARPGRPRRRAALGSLLLLAWLAVGPDGSAAAPGAPPDGQAGERADARAGSPLASAGSGADFAAGRLWRARPPEEAAGDERRIRSNLVHAAKLGLSLLASGWLLWAAVDPRSRPGRAGERAAPTRAGSRVWRAGLAGLAVASLFAWSNFLQFHYPGYVHVHDVYSYYVGAKYFRELGYTRLYECMAVADLEAGLGERVRRRVLTDLETYELVDGAGIASDPGRCKRHFSAERWAAYRRDLAWFRARTPPEVWERLSRDHGYNPTPTWGVLGTLLASTGPASALQVLTLVALDPLLLLAMWGVALWAFGWPATAVAMIFWGTNPVADFAWTGGSFLREDWLVASVVGLALLRRGRPLLAGVLLGHAAMLRVFPALMLAAIGLKAVLEAVASRRPGIGRTQRRIAAGAALAGAVGLGIGSLVAGGWGAWPAFVHKARLHVATPASNTLGLASLLAHSQESRLAVLSQRPGDFGRVWKRARERVFAERRWLYVGLVAGYLLLLARALRGQQDWIAGVLGLGALPVLLEPAGYYTSCLLAFGFLWSRSPGTGAALCGLSLAQWLAAARWSEPDDFHAGASAATLAFVVLATSLARRKAGR